MATPGKIVAVIARATRIPEPTVAQIDRKLFAAGLRTKGGRGRSAAKVTAGDASRLLTAVLGNERIVDAVYTVRRMADNIVLAELSDLETVSKIGIEEFNSLGPEHSFTEALQAIITAESKGTLWPAIAKYAEQFYSGNGIVAFNPITVGIISPLGQGRIVFNFGLGGPEEIVVRYCNHRPGAPKILKTDASDADLYTNSWVTYATIEAIGAALAD